MKTSITWGNVNFPTRFDDITTFETNNIICVNIVGYHENKKKINPIRLGHIPYLKNGNINLLLIKDNATTDFTFTLRNSTAYCTQFHVLITRTATTAPSAGK